MKFLLDENLSRRLVPQLEPRFPGSKHVVDVGLAMASDIAIWEHAKQHGFTILTKHDDFLVIANQRGTPPKLVMIGFGNSANTVLARRLLGSADALISLADATSGDIIKLM